jgi:hypothetical protein
MRSGYTNNLINLFKPEQDESAKWENRAEIYQKLRDYMIGATGAEKETRFLIPEIIDVNDHLPCLCQRTGLARKQLFLTFLLNYTGVLVCARSRPWYSPCYNRRPRTQKKKEYLMQNTGSKCTDAEK